MLPVQSHGERSLVDGSLYCILKHLGVDEGAGCVQHLAFTAQDVTRCAYMYVCAYLLIIMIIFALIIVMCIV